MKFSKLVSTLNNNLIARYKKRDIFSQATHFQKQVTELVRCSLENLHHVLAAGLKSNGCRRNVLCTHIRSYVIS